MKYLMLILLVTVSSTVTAHGETMADPYNQTKDAGIGLCFDDVCVNSGMTEPVPPTKSQIEAYFKQCLKERENQMLKVLDETGVLKSEEQIFMLDEQLHKYCDRNDLSVHDMNKLRLEVQKELINYWLKSRGA